MRKMSTAWLSLSFAVLVSAPQSYARDTVANQIHSHQNGIAVWWTGNAGWLIKSGDLLIGTDLTLDNDDKVQPPPVTALEIANDLNVLLVTHHHGDHCNPETISQLVQKSKCTFVLPNPCVKELKDIKIPRERLIVPEPLHPFTVQGMRVEPIHAIHGNQEFTVLTREADFVDKIAHNCGYVFSLGGKRFFEPGDSVLTEEQLSLRNIDVLFISPTRTRHVHRSIDHASQSSAAALHLSAALRHVPGNRG